MRNWQNHWMKSPTCVGVQQCKVNSFELLPSREQSEVGNDLISTIHVRLVLEARRGRPLDKLRKELIEEESPLDY